MESLGQAMLLEIPEAPMIQIQQRTSFSSISDMANAVADISRDVVDLLVDGMMISDGMSRDEGGFTTSLFGRLATVNADAYAAPKITAPSTTCEAETLMVQWWVEKELFFVCLVGFCAKDYSTSFTQRTVRYRQ